MSSKTFRIFQNKMVLLFLIIALFMLSGCAPLITDFTPDRGPVGTEVTIKGENFFWIQYVKFEEGRTENFDSHFRLFSEDWIDTKVSYGATTGKIRVRNIFGTGVSANDFIVEKETWSKSYGGTATDTARSIQQTTDGGYIVAGYTTSFGEVNDDFWVLKLFANGDIHWQKTYGGTAADTALSIQQTTDRGYIIAGATASFGAGNDDIWILKLDESGDIIWQKTYGGTANDVARSIQQTTDGGYIVAGYTTFLGEVNGDFWVLKLDGSGDIIWQKTYGGTAFEGPSSIQQITDGGYIVAGNTRSFGAVNGDFWVLKLDGSGDIIWQKTYGDTAFEGPSSIQQTTGGGYIVAGVRNSYGAVFGEFWVLKLDGSGDIIWQKTYGGTDFENALSIQQTTDEGYIVAGFTVSFGTSGSHDFWILKLDGNGDIIWQKTYGGSYAETALSIQQTTDEGYIVAGTTVSFGVARSVDFWVLKLDEHGNISESCPPEIGQNTSAIPADTSVVPQDTLATVTTSSSTITSTTVTPADTNATIETQCTN